MSQHIDPRHLLHVVGKCTDFDSVEALKEYLHVYLPYPSHKSRERMITYILSLVVPHDGKGRIIRTPMFELAKKGEEVRRDLTYWQLCRRLRYLGELSAFLGRKAGGKVGRKEVEEFLFGLMGKRSPTTLSALLSILRKFGMLEMDKEEVVVPIYVPSFEGFAYTICEEMLERKAVTLQLSNLGEERVVLLFHMSPQRALEYIEGENHLWQVERRPPLNRLLLLVSSLEEAVERLLRI